jgi:uncharacterized protein with PQ loop repeat
MDGLLNLSVMTLVAAGANVLGASMAIPQATRLIRHRRVEGVSAVWAAMSITVNVWWVAYAVGAGEWAIMPVAVISVAAYSAVAMALARYSPARPRAGVTSPLLAAAAIGSLPLLALTVGGWPVAGVVLGMIYGIQMLPAVIIVYRSHDLTGVSAATWTMAWSEALLWGIYGVAGRDPGLLSFGAAGLVVSTAILVRLAYRRHPITCSTSGFPERGQASDPVGQVGEGRRGDVDGERVASQLDQVGSGEPVATLISNDGAVGRHLVAAGHQEIEAALTHLGRWDAVDRDRRAVEQGRFVLDHQRLGRDAQQHLLDRHLQQHGPDASAGVDGIGDGPALVSGHHAPGDDKVAGPHQIGQAGVARAVGHHVDGGRLARRPAPPDGDDHDHQRRRQ